MRHPVQNRVPKTLPDYAHELDARLAGARRIAGVDEVGRGPLAGPVTAAAVVLDPLCLPRGLNDSKTLTARQRAAISAQILDSADCCIVHVWLQEIEQLNILNASLLAMKRALAGLSVPADLALIDGNRVPPGLAMPAKGIVKGDAQVLSIAAASIIAKVARDRLMEDLAQQCPGYGWDRNAGYPTPEHKRALLYLGITPYHRRGFAPVHNMLCKVTKPSD